MTGLSSGVALPAGIEGDVILRKSDDSGVSLVLGTHARYVLVGLRYGKYDRYGGFSAGDKHWPVAPGDLSLSGGDVSYTYDGGSGLKTQMVDSAGTSQYGYDARGRLTFYIREPGGELIARATGQTRQYYFFDRLGSTIAMVPAVEGNPTDRLFYTPWGELVTTGSRASTVGTSANPYRYVGQIGYYYHHQDANLADWMQLGVRFYQPEIGRFERRDPALPRAPYNYASGAPLVAIDPNGMLPGRYSPCERHCTAPGVLAAIACRVCKGVVNQVCKRLLTHCCDADNVACHLRCEDCTDPKKKEDCTKNCELRYTACLLGAGAFE